MHGFSEGEAGGRAGGQAGRRTGGPLVATVAKRVSHGMGLGTAQRVRVQEMSRRVTGLGAITRRPVGPEDLGRGPSHGRWWWWRRSWVWPPAPC